MSADELRLPVRSRRAAGFCKLYGLRLQLDNASVPVQKFLGQPLDVRVAVRDAEGRVAETGIHVNVGATTIGD